MRTEGERRACSRGGQKVALTITVDYPQGDPDSKITFDETDNTKLVWTGDEKMTLIFGDTASETDKDNTDNPSLSSVAPGVFSGTITTPEGYDMTQLQGLVVPGVEGAAFLWSSATDKRISMPIPAEQTQAEIGKPNWDYVPFFYDLSGTEMTQGTDGSYAFAKALTLKSACDLVAFNVHEKHAAMAEDEVLKSVKLIPVAYGSTTKIIVAGYSDWTLESTGTGLNSYGSEYIKVTLENQPKVSDISESGALVYASAIFGGTRYIGMVEVETDRGVYRKSFATPKSFPQKNVTAFNVFNVGLDLSTFDNESGLRYSVDGSDESWSATMPEEFEALHVKTVNYIMTAEDLSAIKTAIDSQENAVALDLTAAQYESYIFPTTFAGTADANNLKLKSIKFPSNVTEIKASAFAYTSALESVDLTGIKTINTKAFFWSGLKTLNVPKTVTNFAGYQSFGCCTKLTEIYYDSPTTQKLTSSSSRINHAVFAFVNMTGSTVNPINYAYAEADYPELYPTEPKCTITIGPNVNHLARYMFCYNDNIAKIVFEKKVTVGNYAFDYMRNVYEFDCTQLTEPLTSYESNNYQRDLGMKAKNNGKTPKILVKEGLKDTFAAKYPFKGMVSKGWEIEEVAAE